MVRNLIIMQESNNVKILFIPSNFQNSLVKHYPIQLTAQIFQNRTILSIEHPNFINIHVILGLEFL